MEPPIGKCALTLLRGRQTAPIPLTCTRATLPHLRLTWSQGTTPVGRLWSTCPFQVDMTSTTHSTVPHPRKQATCTPVQSTSRRPLWCGLWHLTPTTMCSPSQAPSFIATNTYSGVDAHTIPVVSVSGDDVGDGEWFGDEGAHIEFFYADGPFWVEATGDSNEHGNDSNFTGSEALITSPVIKWVTTTRLRLSFSCQESRCISTVDFQSRSQRQLSL